MWKISRWRQETILRNCIAVRKFMYQAHSEQHLGQSNSSRLMPNFAYTKKIPCGNTNWVSHPLSCQFLNWVHSEVLKPVDISNHEWVSRSWARVTLSTAWEAGTRRQGTTGQKGELCSAAANHCISWTALTRLNRSQALAINKEPYRQNPEKSFLG